MSAIHNQLTLNSQLPDSKDTSESAEKPSLTLDNKVKFVVQQEVKTHTAFTRPANSEQEKKIPFCELSSNIVEKSVTIKTDQETLEQNDFDELKSTKKNKDDPNFKSFMLRHKVTAETLKSINFQSLSDSKLREIANNMPLIDKCINSFWLNQSEIGEIKRESSMSEKATKLLKTVRNQNPFMNILDFLLLFQKLNEGQFMRSVLITLKLYPQ